MIKPRLWTKDFIFVCLGNFFVFNAFYILLVTLPIYAIDQVDSTNAEAGLLTTVFLVSAIIIRPIAGYWLEKFGKKNVLVTALVLFALPSIFYFVPETITGLLILRFIHGIGFGMATTATGAIVADIVPNSRRGEGMGYFILSVNIAMVLGPFIGLTVMSQWNTTVLFLICIFSAFIALLSGFGITIARPKTVESGYSFRKTDLFEASAVPISLIGGFYGFIYASILSFVSVYANQIGLMDVSNLFFVVYAAILLLSRPITGKWYDLYGENWIIYPSLILYGIGMFVLGTLDSAFLFIVAAALIGIGWGTASPSFQTIAVQNAAPNRRGMATATYLSIFDFGIGIGSFVVGFALNEISFQTIYQTESIIIFVGILIYYLIYGRYRSKLRQQLPNN